MRLAAFLTALLLTGGAFAAGQESSANLIAQADKYWTEGRVEQAQQSFEAAVAADPRSAEATFRLAGFQLSSQKLEASIASYKQTIGLSPKNALAWMGLGIAYLHTGRRELARASFDEAVRIDPKQKEKLAPLIEQLASP